jgi:hypothetical protein
MGRLIMRPMNASTEAREPILSPVDRVSEMCFGLFMAVTFVGAVSASGAARDEVRTMFFAALGCNLAWGLVDAVMFLVRTITDRGRARSLALAVRRAPDAAAGRSYVEQALSPVGSALSTPEHIESIRARIAAMPELPSRPMLHRDDAVGSVAIFLIVVASTFPVVLPFIFIADVGTAKLVSRAVALAMLFIGGLALGRYSGYGTVRMGFAMVGLGVALIVSIMALGG